MLGFLAIIIPPLVMILRGRIIAAIFCAVLQATLIGWPIASLWALTMTRSRHNEKDRVIQRKFRLDALREQQILEAREAAAKTSLYEEAIADKKAGNLNAAGKKLEQLCRRPSIYKGHYKELFKIWRQLNEDDLKAGNYDTVIARVEGMVKYDDEMIEAMLSYWSEQQRTKLPNDYFDKDRNLRVTDAKALLKAASAVDNMKLKTKAEKLIRIFEKH